MIIAAALKISQPPPLDYIQIVGLRHSNCYTTLQLLNPDLSKKAREENLITEGFIDHKNHFHTRREAYLIARDIGQLSWQNYYDKLNRNEFVLYSEDLY